MSSRVRLIAVVFGLAVASASPAPAQLAPPAPAPLATRLLQVEDARLLGAESQAVLVEGTRDRDPRLRAQAVRAMGRFESPALLGYIIPLLSDSDPSVRQAAAVAAANAAKVFPTQAIEALTRALDTSPPADWAVFAASLGRIALSSPAEFAAAESAIAAGLPPVAL
ncbi:MAG: HEAT repeat domain-containing protein, partial [Vicinamibacterales bacterium]